MNAPKHGFLASWHVATQVAVALGGIILAFVQRPPTLSLSGNDTDSLVLLTRFITTMIVLACLTLALKSRGKERWKGWMSSGTLALVVGLVLFATYRHLRTAWTCTVSGKDLITGSQLTPEAGALPAVLGRTCNSLLELFGSDPRNVWLPHSLYTRLIVLDWSFVLSVILFSFAAISFIQARKLSTGQ